MHFLHLTVEPFDLIENPDDCAMLSLGLKERMLQPQFSSGKWGVEGLKLQSGSQE